VKHLEVENWSRRTGPLHRLDARAKVIAVLLILVFAATARPWTPGHVAFYAALALAAAAFSKQSWRGLARRLLLVMPFPLVFAGLSWVSTGNGAHAAALVSRSMVSAAFAVVLISVTPLPALLEGVARLGAPRVLTSVAQLVYRYLFVLFDQAMRMRLAAACRGGFRWHAASSAAAALFASSEERALRVHRAMQARGFQGRDPVLTAPAWRPADTLLVVCAVSALLTARLLWQL